MYKIKYLNRVIEVSDYAFEKYVQYYSNNDLVAVIDKLHSYKELYEKFLSYKKSDKDYFIHVESGINKKGLGLPISEVKKIFHDKVNGRNTKPKKTKTTGLP